MSQPSWAPDFEVEVQSGALAGERVIKVRGELDSGTCPAVLHRFHETLADPSVQSLTLDLQQVTFVDSTGTRAIIMIEHAAREQETPLVVVPPPEQVTQLLRTAGVTGRLQFGPRSPDAPEESEFEERVELELARDPQSPSRARAEVRELLAGRLNEDELARAVLLTSELVTNAVIHPRVAAQAPIALRITSYADGVRVEVEDAGDGFDLPLGVTAGERGGRGLFLVDSCAAQWGAVRALTERGPRFRVWFELESGAGRDSAADSP